MFRWSSPNGPIHVDLNNYYYKQNTSPFYQHEGTPPRFIATAFVSSLVLSHFSCVRHFATPRTIIPQAPVHGILQARILEWVAISFSRDLPNPGIKPASPVSPALEGGFFIISATWEALLPSSLATTYLSSCL